MKSAAALRRRLHFIQYGLDYAKLVVDTRAWLQKLEASKGQDIAAKAKTETNYSCAEQMKQNAPAHAINWQAVFRLPGFSGRTAKPTRACNIRQIMLAVRS